MTDIHEEAAKIFRSDVYFNLHSRVWSVKNRQTGRVGVHAPVVVFSYPARFVVSEAGRQRVLREKRKNVHAFVRANAPFVSENVELWREDIDSKDKLIPLSYNPYKGPTFYRKDTGTPITDASSVVMLAVEGKPPLVVALFPV